MASPFRDCCLRHFIEDLGTFSRGFNALVAVLSELQNRLIAQTLLDIRFNGPKEMINDFIFFIVNDDFDLPSFPDEFFQVPAEDISRLHPVIALRILQKFQFRKFSNGYIWRIESVDHWSRNSRWITAQDRSVQENLRNSESHIIDILSRLCQLINKD